MPDTPTPEPDDNPPTREPSVYGSQWGETGASKAPGQPPPDAPQKIKPPNDEPRRQT